MTKKPVTKMLKRELLDEVERQRKEIENLSSQPRFIEDTSKFFGSVIRWVKMANIEAPPYSSDNKTRDTWLSKFWQREPHLAGVVNSVIAIDKNRGWTLTGGRNQVKRYVNILHYAEGGRGWRSYFGKDAFSFYCSDIGSITEVGRDGEEGPMRGLYNVDSSRCKLTGNIETPLNYKPKGDVVQAWTDFDFFRLTSMESTDEDFNGLGFCAISRVIELAKIMVAIWEHDQEKLGARAARGLLLLHNVSEAQWEEAMNLREAKLDSLEQRYYGAVAVLASSGMEQIDAKLVALSQLPDNFDQQTAVDLTMYGYALCFGFDPSEFWPVKYGSLGRGRETEIQHIKATGKGGLDHVLSYQEQLQEELPDSLQFEFEHRDEAGELLGAEVMQAKVEAIGKAYEIGLAQFVPMISKQEARSLLAQEGVIPYEWTEIEEDVEITDTEDPEASKEKAPQELERDKLLSNPHVLRACEMFQDDPIVRYHFPKNRYTTLFANGHEATRNRYFKVAKRRQDESEILYQDEEVTITQADADRAIEEGGKRVGAEYRSLLLAPEMTQEELDEFYLETGEE